MRDQPKPTSRLQLWNTCQLNVCRLSALIAVTFVTAISARSAPTTPPTVRIATFAGDRAAAISYTFDDGIRDQYTLAVPMLNEVGFKGTFFVIPGAVAKTVEEAENKRDAKRAWGGITWEELRKMSDQGHEIASHTWSHQGLLKLTPDEVEAEFSKASESIQSNVSKPALTLAFPFNQSNADIQAVARKHYVAYRDKQTGVGGEKSTVAWLNNWADQQIAGRKWGVIMAHAIGHGYSAFTDPEILRTHLKYVKTRTDVVWVDTFANVALYVKERDDAKLTFASTGPRSIRCQLTGTLDVKTYNVPLTIVLEVAGVTTVEAEQSGRKLPTRIAANNVQIDAVPRAAAIEINWR